MGCKLSVLNKSACSSRSAVLGATVTNHTDHAAPVGLSQHRFDRIPVPLCQRESKNMLIVVWMLGDTQSSAWKKKKRKGGKK